MTARNAGIIMKILLIEWVDSFSGASRWTQLDDIKKLCEPYICHSVGFLLKETKDHIMLIQNHSKDERDVTIKDQPDGLNYITIPKKSVRKMRILRQK